MAAEQYKFILDVLAKLPLPPSSEITEEGRIKYEKACDIELMYRGDSKVLIQAIHMFMLTEVLPYAYAGAASVIAAASYISGGKSDPKGLKAASQWLDKAKAIVDDRFEINIVAYSLYDGPDKHDKRRALLDELKDHPDAQDNYRYAVTEMRYWDKMNNLVQVKQWHDKAVKLAQNDIQKLYALNLLAGIYLGKRPKEALALYKEVVTIDPRDPWAWHNMSIIAMNAGDLTSAGSYNDRALNLMDFGNAHQIRAKLIGRWAPKRHADTLDDMPPYTFTETAKNQNQAAAMFKRLFGG